ncbi:hypothetical protein BC830DRAFT_1065579 [Chytriomyces sp. MP71]|nr:hypothetical protein BC830DRAFT_1065579 [Chytriomyces sp. MP71]
MSDEKLPFLMDLQTNSSPAEIQTLRTEYEKQTAPGSRANPQTKFDFAYALIKSPFRKDQEQGIRLLHELYKEHPSRRRECLYYLSVGNYKLAQFVEARKYNEILLQLEPRNAQSLQLRELIDGKVRTDGLVGMAIVGGLIAGVAALGVAVFGGARGSKK